MLIVGAKGEGDGLSTRRGDGCNVSPHPLRNSLQHLQEVSDPIVLQLR